MPFGFMNPQNQQAMPQGGVGGFLGNNSNMLMNLGAGLLDRRQNANVPMSRVMQGATLGSAFDTQRKDKLAETQKTETAQNASAQWLKSLGKYSDEQIGQFTQMGIIGDVVGQEMKAQNQGPKDLMSVAKGATVFDPNSRQWIAPPGMEGIDGDQFDMEQKLRKEAQDLPNAKDFDKITGSYQRILSSAAMPSPAGDLSLIFNYMKMLDPGSVVRESEFATAASAKPLLERLGISFDAVSAVWEGKRLTPNQRMDFINRAGELYGGMEGLQQQSGDYYEGLAQEYGLDPQRVVPGMPQIDRSQLPPPPEPGMVMDGYRYVGGDPANPQSWQEVR